MPVPLSLSSIVQLSSDHIAAPVDNEIVILSIKRGAYYGLNDVGSDIWQRLAAPVRVDALCDLLAEKYNADRATIERDVLALLEKLMAEGLVTLTN